MKKELLVGFVIGILANIAGSYLYIFFFSEYTLETTLQIALEEDVLGNIIALGAVLTLCTFFIFLKKNQIYRARGAVFAVIVASIIVLISKFY